MMGAQMISKILFGQKGSYAVFLRAGKGLVSAMDQQVGPNVGLSRKAFFTAFNRAGEWFLSAVAE